MSRSTLIIGNGLGMALDPNFFKLDCALEEMWNRPNLLTRGERKQIQLCVNAQGIDDRPHGEDDLDVLHLAVLACQLLDSISSARMKWLTKNAQSFPSTIEKYITAVAWYFHHFNGDGLPQSFILNLARFLAETRSHIATLNYDNLLYSRLIDLKILRGYDGPLVDGFYVNQGTFHPSHLVRMGDKDFGYYLHLHGSPLFVGDNDAPRKQSQASKDESIPTPHLVLTHVKHKRSVIANSFLLTTYWDYLERGLKESKTIIVFGYSGYDSHLNEIITKHANGKRVFVIEWLGNGHQRIRKSYWRRTLKVEFELIQLENILEFIDWDDIQN